MDQDQGSVKRPKQPDLAGQAQASKRTKRRSKSFGDVKDNLKRRRRFYDAQVLALALFTLGPTLCPQIDTPYR